MAWLARTVVSRAALVLGCAGAGVGCAAIAGIGEGTPEPDNGGSASTQNGQVTAEGGSSGSSSSSGSAPPQDSGGRTDDAATDAGGSCPPPKKPNDSACTEAKTCCGACAENRKCVTSCKTSGSCSLGGDSCCIGTYCSFTIGAKCDACIKDGDPAELYLAVPNSRSCCSGNASFVSGKCVK